VGRPANSLAAGANTDWPGARDVPKIAVLVKTSGSDAEVVSPVPGRPARFVAPVPAPLAAGIAS
jgi:hypothetical protein